MATALKAKKARSRAAVLLVLASGVALAACARKQDPDLELACAVRECECLPENPGIFRTPRGEEVLWRQNGNAYCREGYVLRLVEQ